VLTSCVDVLNWIFAFLVLGSVVTAAFSGTMESVSQASMASAKGAVELALGLIGQLALWLGFMAVLREAGALRALSRALSPLLRRLFPDVPRDHPALSAISLNLAANFLGMSNAATPFGLKAIAELETLNPSPGVATNAMALFLAINTSCLALPLVAVAVRATAGARHPGAIIVPSLLASAVGCSFAIVVAKLLERAPAFRLGHRTNGQAPIPPAAKHDVTSMGREAVAAPVEAGSPSALGWALAAAVVAILLGAAGRELWRAAPGAHGAAIKAMLESWLIPLLMSTVVLIGIGQRVRVYEAFVEAAKEGFQIAVSLIPYLVALLVGVGMFRASGALDGLVHLLTPITQAVGFPAEALPMALIRPLSGSGALAVMTDTMKAQGPDSFVSFLVSVMNGTSETTFYILAVYYGSVGVKAIRHTLVACLLADLMGIVAATVVCRMFY
jgi:spore maturation protein SpmA